MLADIRLWLKRQRRESIYRYALKKRVWQIAEMLSGDYPLQNAIRGRQYDGASNDLIVECRQCGYIEKRTYYLRNLSYAAREKLERRMARLERSGYTTVCYPCAVINTNEKYFRGLP